MRKKLKGDQGRGGDWGGKKKGGGGENTQLNWTSEKGDHNSALISLDGEKKPRETLTAACWRGFAKKGGGDRNREKIGSSQKIGRVRAFEA